MNQELKCFANEWFNLMVPRSRFTKTFWMLMILTTELFYDNIIYYKTLY